MLIFKRQIKKQEESGHVTSQETRKWDLKEAIKVSFEKKIQGEFRPTVDTMIRTRASRKTRFLKKDNSRMRAEKECCRKRGLEKQERYIYIYICTKTRRL